MIESYENAIQIAVLIVCTACALYRAARARSRTWTLLALFTGSWLLGDLYWVLYMVFSGRPSQIPVVSDLSWYASYLFLYMLIRQLVPPEGVRSPHRVLPWAGPVFAFAMAGFYMQWGQVLSNLIYAALLSLVLFAVISRLSQGRDCGRCRFLFITGLVFCLLEYGLWTSSCFWDSGTLADPYYWFDMLLTISFPVFVFAVRKAEKA